MSLIIRFVGRLLMVVITFGLLAPQATHRTVATATAPPTAYTPTLRLMRTPAWSPRPAISSHRTILIAPQGGANITTTKTVGLDSQICAATDSITVPPNTPVFYCYVITNTGSVTFTHHTLTDDRLGTIVSDFPYTLTPGGSAFITATTTIAETTLNTATWTATNGTDTATATDTALVIIGGTDADLAIHVTGAPAFVVPGEHVTYTITATNHGPATANDISIRTTPPSGMTFISIIPTPGGTCTTPPIGANGDIACTVPPLTSGTSAQLTLSVEVSPSIALGARFFHSFTSSASTDDPVLANNTAVVETRVGMRIFLPLVQVSRPRLMLTIRSSAIPPQSVAQPGQPFYTVTLTLSGGWPIDGHYYLAASPTSLIASLVDDAVILRDGPTERFRYDYGLNGPPQPALVEVPLDALIPRTGQGLTVIFTDLHGGQMSATPLYVLWTP